MIVAISGKRVNIILTFDPYSHGVVAQQASDVAWEQNTQWGERKSVLIQFWCSAVQWQRVVIVKMHIVWRIVKGDVQLKCHVRCQWFKEELHVFSGVCGDEVVEDQLF